MNEAKKRICIGPCGGSSVEYVFPRGTLQTGTSIFVVLLDEVKDIVGDPGGFNKGYDTLSHVLAQVLDI